MTTSKRPVPIPDHWGSYVIHFATGDRWGWQLEDERWCWFVEVGDERRSGSCETRHGARSMAGKARKRMRA